MPDERPPATAVRAPEGVPAPERHEPVLRDPGLTDFTLRDWRAILTRTGKGALAHRLRARSLAESALAGERALPGRAAAAAEIEAWLRDR